MNASPREINLKLTGLAPGTTFLLETLDKEHGNAYDVWKSIGAPHSPTREQEIYLRQQAWNTQMETLRVADDGTLPIRRTLSPWSCMLIKEL